MKKIYFLLATVFIASVSIAQNREDTTDGRFHDDLLDHLVGKWNVSGIVHGGKFTLVLEAKWVVSHQWLQVYEKGNENVPGANVPYEAWFYVGYNHFSKRYVAHLMNLFGGDNEVENLFSGNRTGNQIKFISKSGPDAADVEEFIWEPASQSWHLISSRKTIDKPAETYLDLKVIKAPN